MGQFSVGLLLLLSSYVLAQQGSDEETCLSATRLKPFRNYVYQYTTEVRNEVVGSTVLWNGPRISCQVELEVPQPCSFVLHTRSCVLSEGSGAPTLTPPPGPGEYRESPETQAFQAAMERNPLQFTVDGAGSVSLYPNMDEPLLVLNIKRGVVSALLVPANEDKEKQQMSTVHGVCSTHCRVSSRTDATTHVTFSRDLHQCDGFRGVALPASPLALIQRLEQPISKLMRSTQDCTYQFDSKRKHVTKAECMEKHVFLPFSLEKDGMSSVVMQTLTLQDHSRINNRLFEVEASRMAPLRMASPLYEAPPLQERSGDACVGLQGALLALSGPGASRRRPALFLQLVSCLRGLGDAPLARALPPLLRAAPALAWQALLQCGTAQCTGAALEAGGRASGAVGDALALGLGLLGPAGGRSIRDLLGAARARLSKASVYALAHSTTRFYKVKGGEFPELADVSQFMETLLKDCSQNTETSFLALRAVGVMGQGLLKASPGLISSVLRCIQNPSTPPETQKAAVQAFRLVDLRDQPHIRSVLLWVYRDPRVSVGTRVAAYLTLMKSPDQTLVEQVLESLGGPGDQRDPQLRSFVVSHLSSIRHSNNPDTAQLKAYIKMAVSNQLSFKNTAFTGTSRNYEMETPWLSMQANTIFDTTDTLPQEVMLETTLRVLDYNYDIFQVGVEGKGFEPTIDALFGEKGFFPEAVSKAMYMAVDKAPETLRTILDRGRMKRQVPQDLLLDIKSSVNSLLDTLRASPAPEVTAYLRLLGVEAGYVKTSEMRQMAETLMMYYDVYIKALPAKAFGALTSGTDNELFAHYIFMDNAFSLPTTSGLPLKVSLAGVFTPGVRGGLDLSPGMKQLSFMPSVGLELITHMGVQVPDWLATGVEMHTNVYHESSLSAKVTFSRNQLKVSFPAPDAGTQLFSFSHLPSLSSRGPPLAYVEDEVEAGADCRPLFTGLKYCTSMHCSSAGLAHPGSRFTLEVQPTGEVREYTATAEMLPGGAEGRPKVDSLRLSLKAEGAVSSEVTATLKYNRNRSTVTAEVVIPDLDVEAGVRLAVMDTRSGGQKVRGVTIDVTNRNVPQLTLVGRARLEKMKDAMLEVQMAVPSLNAEASLTANLMKDERVVMGLEASMSLSETTSWQKVTLRYDDDKVEVEVNSDMKSEILKLMPNVEAYHHKLQQAIDDMLDHKVTKTDMKLRHIVTKGIEAGNIWLDKLAVSIPYINNLQNKRSISELSLPGLPEKVFLQSDSLFRYQFNKDKMAISIPLPLGGQTSAQLNIPDIMSTPPVHLPELGVHIPSQNYNLPSFTIPRSVDLMLPLLGLAEASTNVRSNMYNWEGSISGGNNTVDIPRYIAHYKFTAQSPFSLLSYKLEGTAMMSGRPEDFLKNVVNSTFSHSLVDTSFSITETLSMTDRDKINYRANCKIEASSPLGLQTSVYYSAKSTSRSDEIIGDGSLDMSVKVGSLHTNTSYTHRYALHFPERKGRGECNLRISSPLFQTHNTIQGVFGSSELSIVSKTNVQNDALKHVVELKYKDAQLTLKCSAVAKALGTSLSNKAELGLSRHMAVLRVESQADDATNRAYSLIRGSLNANGIEINSEGSLMFRAGRALHKASLTVGRKGLTTTGMNNIQCSPVTLENTFIGAIDSSGASLSSKSTTVADEGRGELHIEGKVAAAEAYLNSVLKGYAHDASTRNTLHMALNQRALTISSDLTGSLRQMSTENSHTLTLSLWTLAVRSKTNNFICEDAQYKHDIKIDMKPFITSLDITNDLNYYDWCNFNNEAHMKFEPLKMHVTGSVKGAFREDQKMKHTYEISYDDMAGAMTFSTSGNVPDAHLSHNCDFEFAGFSSKSKCEARINSTPLHFHSSIRTMALPFSLTIDTLVNGDGEINLQGKHTAQLYSRVLVKAQPLAFAYSQDYRASTTHALDSGDTSTHIDNKFDGLLIPSEQSLTWKSRSKLNDHSYSQDVSAYNNPEKIGVEFTGLVLTDVFSKLSSSSDRSQPEIQEFNMSGFLKYDKHSECHIIVIPFIDSLPIAFENLKMYLVNALESLQQFINYLDMNGVISRFTAKLDQLPKQVHDFMVEEGLEKSVNEIKVKLTYLTNDFAITMDDLERAMENLKRKFEITVLDIATKIRDLILTLNDFVEKGSLSDAITTFFSKIENELLSFEQTYQIKSSLLNAIDAVEDVVRQIDLQKLAKSGHAWLQEHDSKYNILENFKEKMADFKQGIEAFEVNRFIQDVKDFFLSIDVAMYVKQLKYTIPSSEITQVIDSMKTVIVNWIDEYEVPIKLNALYSYIRDQLVRYNIHERFKELLDELVELVKDFKIEQTVQSLVDTLRSINYQYVYDEIVHFIDCVTTWLKAIDFKQSIDELNKSITSTLKSLKDFDYNAFVDYANNKIPELTHNINEQIKTYEIVQKFEAFRDFLREIQHSIYQYIEKLKNTKLSELVNKLNDVIDTTAYNDIRMKVQEILADARQRIIDMDIREEMYIHLGRASESYSNIISYIISQFNHLLDNIRKVVTDHTIVNQLNQAADGILETLQNCEIEVSSFIIPFTDLIIPKFTIYLNKLHEINIPSQISVPKFTILDFYPIPAFTIDFEEMKACMVAIIDHIREFKIEMPTPEELFGDLRTFYLFELPDLSFSEITLSEIIFPTFRIPKLNLEDFEITMLPIPEIKIPEFPSGFCIPLFGKLHGEFRVNSPYYTFVTTGAVENSTMTLKTPQFTATLTSQGKSSFPILDYTLDGIAQLEAPRMKRLLFTQSLKANHIAFSVTHEGSLSISGTSAGATSTTIVNATTEIYTANFIKKCTLTLKDGIIGTMDTSYNHTLNIPTPETSSQAFITQNLAAKMDSGIISVTVANTGNGKWSIEDYTDEGTHKSNLEFIVHFENTKLTFKGETNSKALKIKQTLTAESVILSHVIVEARSETVLPFVKSSVMLLNGEACAGDLKTVITVSHDAELIGRLSGSISNSLELMAQPFELLLDSKNKVNSKVALPLKLAGKMDLQHDYGVILNSHLQRACWAALARFNQYKYNHNVTMENNEWDILVQASANGEANLDFLMIPLTFPELTIPYADMKTPEVKELSLWEHGGLRTLLTTPQQTFDMNIKLNYHKNPHMHSFELDIEPIYSTINHNANVLRTKFEQCRDKVVALLKDSYNQAKIQYVKHKIDPSSQPPRIITVPGYKIPILNIEVSAFRAELPAFSYFVPKEVYTPSFKVPAMGFSVPSYTLLLPSLEFPVIHMPETLNELTLPSFTLPSIQNKVMIPAMGNISCDISFKSTMITLSANAGLYNQSDIVACFRALSESVFDILNVKIDGTTSLTSKRGIKLATIVSLEHNNMQTSHDCSVSLTKRSIDASVANFVKINLPFFNIDMNQELLGSTKVKPNIVSKVKVKYMFSMPLIKSSSNGLIESSLALEALTSYISLDISTKGKTDISIMDCCNFAGEVDDEATLYINGNGLRSTVRTTLISKVDQKQERPKRSTDDTILDAVMRSTFALEGTLQHVFATVDYMSSNNVGLLSTNGKHTVKGVLDFIPLTTLKASVNIEATQPCSLGHIEVVQDMNLAITSEKQSFTWNGKEKLATMVHACDLLMMNDQTEICMKLTESVEGYVYFLKSVKLPVYHKSLWDVLKFGQVSNIDEQQLFNVTSIIVYTKSTDGVEFSIPSKIFENGITFSFPAITLAVPAWVKDIQRSMSSVHTAVPAYITLPPAIPVPAFNMPFTTLHVEPFMVDLNNVNIPKIITTSAFDIMLPGLITVAVPSYTINTAFIQGTISFLSFQIPQYDISISTRDTFSLEEMFNVETTAIVIPQQKVEIPEMILYLPSSVFIPAFGALSATLMVSSPIYNATTTARVENKNSNITTSLKSTCTSTIIFLQYDLDATANLGLDRGVLSLNGNGQLIHSDVKIDWQHVYAHNQRVARHTLHVDVTIPAFVDVNVRYASRRDGITASVSSPSAGFVGLHLQRRSSSHLYGKLFSLSSTGKDTDIVTFKATLRNSEKLNMQTTWNWSFINDVIEGSKERVPLITEAVVKFINKYHTDVFGFNLYRGGTKLKNTISSVIDRAYEEVAVSFSTLQRALQWFSVQGKDLYVVSGSITSVRVEDVKDQITHIAKQVLKSSAKNMEMFCEAIWRFLSETTVTLPGWDKTISGLEIYQSTREAVSMASDRAVRMVYHLMTSIRGIHFTVPGTDFTVNGNDVMEKLLSALRSAQEYVAQPLRHVFRQTTSQTTSVEKWLQKVSEVLQMFVTKTEELMVSLIADSPDIASHIDGIYAKAQNKLQTSRRQSQRYKDVVKQRVQEVFNSINMERVNNDLVELLNVFELNYDGGVNEFVDLLKKASENTTPFIKVTNKSMDIDVPLPFFWKSFSEWPTQSRQ